MLQRAVKHLIAHSHRDEMMMWYDDIMVTCHQAKLHQIQSLFVIKLGALCAEPIIHTNRKSDIWCVAIGNKWQEEM